MTDNPAKVFLRQYLAVSGRVSALQRAIDREMQRAQNTGCFLKEIVVQTSPRGDTMAENIVKAVDATAILQAEIDEANKKLRAILAAINSLKDERQKEVLTRRYITGQSFIKIEQEMHYSETRVFVIHGRALLGINEWLRRANDEPDINIRADAQGAGTAGNPGTGPGRAGVQNPGRCMGDPL